MQITGVRFTAATLCPGLPGLPALLAALDDGHIIIVQIIIFWSFGIVWLILIQFEKSSAEAGARGGGVAKAVLHNYTTAHEQTQ